MDPYHLDLRTQNEILRRRRDWRSLEGAAPVALRLRCLRGVVSGSNRYLWIRSRQRGPRAPAATSCARPPSNGLGALWVSARNAIRVRQSFLAQWEMSITWHVLKCAPCNCHDSAFNDIISLGILQPFPKLVCAAAASPFVCEKAMSRFSTVLRWMLFLRTHGLIAGNYPERTSSRKSDARNKRGARSSAATLAMLHSKVPKSSLPKRL